MSINVAIVEDDNDIRKGLCNLLGLMDEIYCINSYSKAEDFIKDIENLQVDVVMMDINLPLMSGIECVKVLKEKNPQVQFLMCTAYEDSDKIFDSLCAGATGYILKSTTKEKLEEAIKEIYNGGSPMSTQIARKVVTSFQRELTKNEHLEKLSQREKEILELLTKGYRYKEIASDLFISTETVRTHIRNIYEKLQVQSRTEAINKVYRS